MRFITLTGRKTGEIQYLNPALITAFGADGEGGTCIVFNCDCRVNVIETPAQVREACAAY
jgi:hypothetical protein